MAHGKMSLRGLALLLALAQLVLGGAALAEGAPDVQAAEEIGGSAGEENPEEVAAEPAPDGAAEPAPDGDLPSGGSADGDASPADDTNGGSVTLTVTAAGDCTFGGEVGSKSNKRFLQCVEAYGYDYFFKNVRDIFEADDITIVNLEGPLTSSDKEKAHGYVFKADPECVNILTGSGVELCNVANNHSLDYGPRGLKDTAETLSRAGVGYCGYTEAWNATLKGVRVTALGFTKWDHTAEQVYQAVTEARENCDLLIVNMHWGWERQYEPCADQQFVGRVAIDAGADLVIGTHPHVIQGIEKYKGKYIVYSLGNFCFAGNANPEDKRCFIFQQTFSFNPGMGIVQANIGDAGINIIPCSISSVPDNNDFVPTVVGPEEGAALLKTVADSSTHFSWSDSRWMKNNYLVANGLVKDPSEAGGEAG